MSSAAAYTKLGWSIIPVDGTTKKPLIPSWKAYQSRRATPDEIYEWSRRFPKGGIAVICGPVSGLLVLDADGEAGATEAKSRGLPKTPMVQTPGGGMHIYFELPKGLKGFKNTCKVGDSGKLDIRGTPGTRQTYVVAPYTKRSDGRRYEWIEKPTVKLAQPPIWFLEMLRQLAEGGKPTAATVERKGESCPPPSPRRPTGISLRRLFKDLAARLDPAVLDWVERGHDLEKFQSRSECDFAVVMGLLIAGATDEEIENIFASYPIGARYREEPNGDGVVRGGGTRYLELTLRQVRRKLRSVRVKYADLIAYSPRHRRLQLALAVEEGDDIGRFIRTGVTVPDDGRGECLARWLRVFEAGGMEAPLESDVTPDSCYRLVGKRMLIEVDRNRQQNQVVAFYRRH